MKYVTFFNEFDTKMVYCNKNGEETPEDIIKSTFLIFVGKFNANEHKAAGCKPIKNDDNIFICRNYDGGTDLYQVCSKVADVTGTIVPHLYYFRKIGVIFD